MHQKSPTQKSGFALVISLSLMAFVLLLLLSITTLVQVETQSSDSSSARTLAQQNALMALNIAIGELQEHTGPDQRVTALADLDNGSNPSSPVATIQPNWVGVWGNQSVANYSQSPSAITPSAPVLLNWLVSGNEDVTYDTATGSTNFGQIISAPTDTDFEFKPTDNTTSLAQATALSTLTIGGNKAAQLLVGRYSTIPFADETTVVTAAQADEKYVVAPLVDIQSSNGTTGRYAWWVGDEGVKAKANVRPSYLDQDSSDQNKYQNYSFLTAQRAALEFVEYDDSGSRLDTEFDFTDPKLERIKELAALPFLSSGSSITFESLISERFHEITTYGHGVLADAYAGGLKKDLTADFNDSSQRPSDDTKIFTPLKADDQIPTWGKARSLVETSISDRKVDPVLPSDTSNGISPVFSVTSLGFDFYLAGPVVDPADPSIAWYEFRVAIIPAVALWNPHAVEINASDYEVGLRIDSDSGKSEVWVDFGPSESDEADVLDLYTGSWNSNPDPNNNFLRFRIQGRSIPPGENQLYSLETNGDIYDPGNNLMTLSEGELPNLYNHVAFTSENLRIPATATYSPRRGTWVYALPNDVFPRVGSNSTRNEGDEMRFNVALAAPNGLSNLNDRDQWYQAILDARLYHRGDQRSDSRASGGSSANVWLDSSHYSNDLNYLLYDAPYELIGDNISAYRMLMPTERRGSMLQKGYWHGALMSSHSNNAARLRWLVTGNPRAPIICNTKVENDHTVSGNSLHAAIHYSNGLTTTERWMGDSLFFPYANDRYTNDGRLSMGRSQNGNQASYSVAVLFDHLESTNNFVSLGQLQHSMVSNYGFHPTYQFGNSWADVRIDRDDHYLANHFSTPYDTSNSQTLYDISWHMNRAVWDRYFVSTVPYTGSNALTAEHIADNRPLPNSRMNYYDSPDLATIQGDDAYDEAAANLWIDGAFNINSTSEQAWRSLLSSTFGIPDDDESFADSGDNVSTIAPIPRFSSNQSQTGHNNTDFTESMKNRTTGNSLNYIGNRGLSMEFNGVSNGTVDEIVSELARTIVEEVKIRGPFLSLGDFVNRAIIEEDPSSDDDDIGIKGALQAAIDNMSPGSGNTGPRVNSRAWQANHAEGLLRTDVEAIMGDKWNVEHYLGGPDKGNRADMPYSTNATGSPKCMSAADLLTVIGPAISARSDTFKIRTYGETVNPVTQKTEGRAWCEAIVQRLPEYVDSTDEPDIAPTALTSIANAQFGRKYKILSLRWLDASEI